MKLKCRKCKKTISKRKDVFDRTIQMLEIDPKDYKRIYMCQQCRPFWNFNWATISAIIDPTNDYDLIVKYKDKLSWHYFYTYHRVSEEFIETFINYAEWSTISNWQVLSESFIEKYKDKVDWYNICRRQKLSPKFIERHIDKINWPIISACQNLPEWFIEKYADKISWLDISKYQTLSEQFIEKHKDKVNWEYISVHQELSPSFITKHIDKITEGILSNSCYEKLPDTIKLLLKTKFGR